MQCSLIISVYNDIKFITLIFEALKYQSVKDFEVIIADDGSGVEFTDVIKNLSATVEFPVKHIWHEDKGRRKDIILNKAVVASGSDYLIFIDGDCIPHHKFIEEHLRFALEGVVVCGRRVQLTEKLSDELTPKKIADGCLGWNIVPELLWGGIIGELRHNEECLRVTNGFLRHLWLKERWHDLLGFNFSMYKSDLLKVNGFDERFLLSATGEYLDLEARLNRIDIYCKVECHIMTVYHKKHKRKDVDNNTNTLVFEENNQNNISWTSYGIVKDV
ncbi:MAG: glycosyltransferase [Bacteroidales bacterium]